ncbi:MAG: hypothetical protein NTW59_02290 [Candidatus Diapherotrites archaeon]|nr:hypothetical protein [Candidatus Diapherotrites archaeon]
MEEAVVTFEQLMEAFPRIKNKSKELAKKILPLCASSELAAIIAALMSDGHIEWYTHDGRPRTRKIILYSSNKIECDWFLFLIKLVFGVTGKVQAYTPNHSNWRKQPYKAIVHSAVVARILILAGAPAGNKTEKEFLAPNWIMNGCREIKKEFLRVFFSFEAGTPYRKSKVGHGFQTALFMNKDPRILENGIAFLRQIIKLLNFFGVSCSKVVSRQYSGGFNSKKNTVYFTITSQKSVVNFYRNIGFLNPLKQSRLESCVLDISKFHRFESDAVCKLMEEVKEKIGADRKLAACINSFTEARYSKRQMEHFRRKETWIPLELVWALIKIKKDEAILKELPDYVQALYKFEPSAPALP